MTTYCAVAVEEALAAKNHAMKISSISNTLALGVGIGLAIFGLASVAPPSSVEKFLRISLDPDPATIVRVETGHPYTVPAHRILVLKSVGDARGSSLSSIQIKVNGMPVVSAQMGGPSPVLLGFPATANAGSIVTVEDVYPDPESLSFAAGYLAQD